MEVKEFEKITKENKEEVKIDISLNKIFSDEYTESEKNIAAKKIYEALGRPEIQKELFEAINLDEDVDICALSFITGKHEVFKTLTGNRQLDNGNLKKLRDSISEHGYRSSQPITINESAEILNGQHRKYICEELGIPFVFNFEREHDDSLGLTVDMNISQKNWVLLDYIKSYADRGYEDYQNFLMLIEEQGITPSLALWLIYHSRNGQVQGKVKNGNLTCNTRDMTIVRRAVAAIKEIRDRIPNNLPGEKALRNAFLGDKIAVPLAIIMDQPNYKHARMLKQVSSMYKSIDNRNMSVCGDTLVAIYNLRLKDSTGRLRPYSEMEE